MIASPSQNGNGHATQRDLVNRIADLDSQYFAARKQRDSEAKSSYASGETSRMSPVPRGVDPLGSDADYHYRTERNYFLHVERGRAAVRNHPLVEQGINRLIANLRLDGFSLDVDSGDPQVDIDQKADWKMWTGETMAGRNLCDYEGRRSFQQIARQSFFNRCSDGDITHLPLADGTIQTWESHHLRNPFGMRHRIASNDDQNGIVHGVEINGGKATHLWITPLNVPFYSSLTRSGQARRYPIYDEQGNKITFWLGFTHRFFQRRGISRLSAPRDAMTGFEDLNYSNIKSALRRALISFLMEDNPNAMPQARVGGDGPAVPQSGDRYATDHGLGLQSLVVEQQGEPAQVWKAPDGKTITGWNANLPPQSFFEHSALLLTMLSVNLDLPLMFFLLDGSLVNFHGGRMTWDQVKLRLMQLQRDEIQGLWGPTYEWRTRLRLTPGHPSFDRALYLRWRAGEVDPFNYKFRPAAWPYVKPAEDVAAETGAEQANLKTMRRILAERGVDWDEEIPQGQNDRASMVRMSLERAFRIAKDAEKKYEIKLDIAQLAREIRYGNAAGQVVMTAKDLTERENEKEETKAEMEESAK